MQRISRTRCVSGKIMASWERAWRPQIFWIFPLLARRPSRLSHHTSRSIEVGWVHGATARCGSWLSRSTRTEMPESVGTLFLSLGNHSGTASHSNSADFCLIRRTFVELLVREVTWIALPTREKLDRAEPAKSSVPQYVRRPRTSVAPLGDNCRAHFFNGRAVCAEANVSPSSADAPGRRPDAVDPPLWT